LVDYHYLCRCTEDKYYYPNAACESAFIAWFCFTYIHCFLHGNARSQLREKYNIQARRPATHPGWPRPLLHSASAPKPVLSPLGTPACIDALGTLLE
jgi:hypothetical protein